MDWWIEHTGSVYYEIQYLLCFNLLGVSKCLSSLFPLKSLPPWVCCSHYMSLSQWQDQVTVQHHGWAHSLCHPLQSSPQLVCATWRLRDTSSFFQVGGYQWFRQVCFTLHKGACSQMSVEERVITVFNLRSGRLAGIPTHFDVVTFPECGGVGRCVLPCQKVECSEMGCEWPPKWGSLLRGSESSGETS